MGKVRSGQIGACSVVLACEKALVRFQDFHQRLAVVLYVSWFSESHVLSAINDFDQ